MRLIYLTNSIIPSRTANSIHSMKICQAFKKNGIDVTLYGIKGNEFNTNEIFNYYDIKYPFDLILYRIPNIKGKLQIHSVLLFLRAIFIHRDVTIYSRSDSASFLISRIRKLIHESHFLAQKNYNRWIEKKVIQSRNIKKIVSISQALKEDIVTKYLVSKNKILVLHDGADKNEGRLEVTLNGFNVGYAGNLYKGRGIELIIHLAKNNRDIKFHVIGGTDDDLNFWYNESTPENIKFHGFISPNKVPDFISAMDVLLMPYQQNDNKPLINHSTVNTIKWMSPIKMFEYMAAGKAIIASDFPVIREVLKDRKNALLCNPAKYSKWNSALCELKKNETFRLSLGRNAKNDFESMYTWDKRAKAIIQILK